MICTKSRDVEPVSTSTAMGDNAVNIVGKVDTWYLIIIEYLKIPGASLLTDINSD